jgi:hypothetical protein
MICSMKFARLSWFAVLTAQAVLLSGCTAALWESDRFARYHPPATPSNLQLFHSAEADDVLVRYDEKREGSRKRTPRAYWLRGDGEPASNPYKPHFVPVQHARALDSIPLFDSTNSTPPPSGYHAIVGANGRDFVLYSGAEEVGCFELPAYMDAGGHAKQVLLTPFAVIVDAVVVAVVAAIIVGPYFLADSDNWD